MATKQLVKPIVANTGAWGKFRILEYQRRMRMFPTECERELGDMLRFMGFEAQVVIGGKRIVDFLHPEKMIVIELDGRQHYRKDGVTLKGGDRRRDRFLEANGIKRILHIPNSRVREQPLTILEEIRRVCDNPNAALSGEWMPSVSKPRKRKSQWPKRKFPKKSI